MAILPLFLPSSFATCKLGKVMYSQALENWTVITQHIKGRISPQCMEAKKVETLVDNSSY